MPRPPRIDVPGLPQHLVVRGHNKQPCFFRDQDRRIFLRYLRQACEASASDLHAFVLMTNHVHLLVTGREPASISKLMHSVGRRYSRHVNRTFGRTGALFEGRFRSSLVESETYFLACMRYIELNPVRAGMVADPADYPWSSHLENASGRPSGFLTPHAEYLRLASDPTDRAAAYTALFREPLGENQLFEIRRSAAKERVLGCEAFRQALSANLKTPGGNC